MAQIERSTHQQLTTSFQGKALYEKLPQSKIYGCQAKKLGGVKKELDQILRVSHPLKRFGKFKE